MPNPIANPLVADVVAEDISDLVRVNTSSSGVVVITLNRPDRQNAFDGLTITALREAFETLHGADHVRIVFLRGEGGCFCAGLDQDWMKVGADWTEEDHRKDAQAAAAMFKALAAVPALTVALVEGSAVGGGAGLAAACDMVLATADAQFAFAEVKLGLIPAVISPYVVAAIGPRAAKGLFATGRTFNAAFAAHIGLVDQVVDGPEALMAAQEQLARDMSAAAPGAAREAKALAGEVWGRQIDSDLIQDTVRRLARRRVSDEGREGVRALLDQRPPSWAAD